MNRSGPRCIPAILSVQPWLYPETISRWSSPPPARTELPSPVGWSLFKSNLGLEILLRMNRPRLQARHAQLMQPSANNLLAHPHRPTPGNLLAQVDPAPANHPMPLRIRSLDHDSPQLVHLTRAQHGVEPPPASERRPATPLAL